MFSFTVLLIVCFVATSTGLQIFGKDADSYVEMQQNGKQFKYGYQVRRVNDQFQHKYKSPQNVTFGCFGYTQPDGELRVYYVADQFGYRTVEDGQIVTIFPQPGTSPVVKQWRELPFPAACFKDDTDGPDQVPAGSNDDPVVVRPEGDSRCWRPFGNDGNKSFMQSISCDASEQSGSGMVTLFYPFRIACTEMEKFETELKRFVAQFGN